MLLPTNARRRATLLLSLAIAIVAAVMMTTISLPVMHAQEATDAVQDTDADATYDYSPTSPFYTKKYMGVSTCMMGCHANPEVWRKNAAMEHVQMNEFCIWKNADKHSLAYEVLITDKEELEALTPDAEVEVNAAAVTMRENLARLRGKDQPLTELAECLSCHSNKGPVEQQFSTAYSRRDGVSCDGCHGPSEDWDAPHRRDADGDGRAEWRSLAGLEKFNTYGMIDVRNPLERSKMCASCHVGSVKDNRVLTHEMYAAGHPPLPAFEVATFSDQLPRHWRSIKEKVADLEKLKHLDGRENKRQVLQAFIDANSLDEAGLSQTKLMLIGGVVALRQSMELLAAHIDQSESSPDAEPPLGRWPGYAHFECFACHHDLKPGDWRQKLGFSGPPGRVPIREWPFVLAEVAARMADQHGGPAAEGGFAETLRAHRKTMTTSLHAQPFGRPAALRDAALALTAWSDKLLAVLPRLKFDQALAASVLHSLAESSQTVRDYDSARQLAWALRVAHNDLRAAYGDPAETDEDSPVADAFKKLDELLRLTLPERPVNVDAASGCAAPIKDFVILKELPKSLGVIARFDPTNLDFVAALAAIRAHAEEQAAASTESTRP